MQYDGVGLPKFSHRKCHEWRSVLDSPKAPMASHCNVNAHCIRQLRQPKLQSSKTSFMAPDGPVTKDLIGINLLNQETSLVVNSKRRGSLKIIVVDLTVSLNPGG